MKKIFLTTLAIACFLVSNGQQIKSKIDQSFSIFSKQPSLTNGIASFIVSDQETGQIVFEKNSTIGLPTASTLKVITAITALDLLGPDYTYKTQLYYAGEIDSIGTLHGDIVIRGNGDPTLGSNRFDSTKEDIILKKWTAAIKDAGIDSIAGRIIADDTFYHGYDIPGGWIWTDMGNYYGAGISAINWRENKTGIDFEVGQINTAAKIKNISANLSYLDIINHVKTASKGSGDNVYAYSAPYSNKILLKGTHGMDLKKTIEISIPDPAYDLAFNLKLELAKDSIIIGHGITTGQRLVEKDSIIPQKTKLLAVHTSPKLSEIVYWFNQKSINLYGEALLKSIGFISGGKTSTPESANYLQKFWEQKLKISLGELDIIDGSGLSPQNNVTTAAMNQIMQYARKRNWFPEFEKSLPTYNQMTMKSGTIGGTLGYTGYHKSKEGKSYTFTLLVYNYKGSSSAMRQKMFELLNTLK